MDRKKNTKGTKGLLRFQGRKSKAEKLMGIADEYHLDMIYEMVSQKKWGVQVTYILSDSPVARVLFPKHSRTYPINANIRSILRHDVIDEIVCCTASLPDEYMVELTSICQQFGFSLQILPYMRSKRIPVSGIRDIAGYLFLALETNPGKRFGYALKSLAEQTFAASALLVLSPMLALIVLLIKFTSDRKSVV